MKEKRLSEIEARESKATAGPWHNRSIRGCKEIGTQSKDTSRHVLRQSLMCTDGLTNDREDLANAVFVARARTDVPDLCAAVRSARKLARAVLLYHQGNTWTDSDAAEWRELTGQEDARMRLAASPDNLRRLSYEVMR